MTQRKRRRGVLRNYLIVPAIETFDDDPADWEALLNHIRSRRNECDFVNDTERFGFLCRLFELVQPTSEANDE